MTSKRRRCDVVMSHRRRYNVMCLLGISPFPLGPPKYSKPWPPQYSKPSYAYESDEHVCSQSKYLFCTGKGVQYKRIYSVMVKDHTIKLLIFFLRFLSFFFFFCFIFYAHPQRSIYSFTLVRIYVKSHFAVLFLSLQLLLQYLMQGLDTCNTVKTCIGHVHKGNGIWILVIIAKFCLLE